jgi:predicted RNA methylase
VATDLEEIVGNITSFYELAGKTIVTVGAGGGQLIGYARQARAVIAVDRDAGALERLAERLEAQGLADRFTLVHGELLALRPQGDVIVFEFCLHEMEDPDRALLHALELGPEVLVIDHAPGSPWMWYAAEESGVERAWTAVARMSVGRQLDVAAVQRFADYTELTAKMARQGPHSLERIARYQGEVDITIPMPYRLALLSSSPRARSISFA